jgi:hypothetical protein
VTFTEFISVDWGVAGRVGTLTYRAISGDGTVRVNWTTSGIVELLDNLGAASGNYYTSFTRDTDWGTLLIEWADGTAVATETLPIPPAALSTEPTWTAEEKAQALAGIELNNKRMLATILRAFNVTSKGDFQRFLNALGM